MELKLRASEVLPSGDLLMQFESVERAADGVRPACEYSVPATKAQYDAIKSEADLIAHIKAKLVLPNAPAPVKNATVDGLIATAKVLKVV
jgi:hypothetical protein